jgi:CheY-like chemotaxis protein
MKPLPPAPEVLDDAILRGNSALALPPILVADDDEDDRFFTIRLLRKIGLAHPILPFDDGIGVVDYLSEIWTGPRAARANQPRLLFLDLKMPGLGGFAFLEWVRDQRVQNDLNIVVLSGSDEPEDMARAKALGAKRYLVKHPSLATFTTIVRGAHRPPARRLAVPRGVGALLAGISKPADEDSTGRAST